MIFTIESSDDNIEPPKIDVIVEDVSTKEVVSEVFVEEIREFSKIIGDNVKKLKQYQNMNEDLAFSLITENDKSQEMINALTGLQRVYGLSLSLEPESIYSSEFREHSEIYDKVAKVASRLSDIIDVTLRIWGLATSSIPSYQTSQKRCHIALTKPYGGVQVSFHGLLLLVISNCEKITGFLDTIERAELAKARLGMVRQDKMSEGIHLSDEVEK